MLVSFQAAEPRASRCSDDVSAWLYQSLFAILVQGQSPKVAHKHYRQIPLQLCTLWWEMAQRCAGGMCTMG